MSANQSNMNKGNQKGGTQDQRRRANERRDDNHSEQSRNDKRHLQQGPQQPNPEVRITQALRVNPRAK